MLAADNWCVRVNQKVYGPYSSQQLRKFAHEGRLAGSSLIAPAGSRDWREARTNHAFAYFFGGPTKALSEPEKPFGKSEKAPPALNGGVAANDSEAPQNAAPRRAQPLGVTIMQKAAQTEQSGPANIILIFDAVSMVADRVEAAIANLGPAFRIADNVWSVTCALTAIGVRNAVSPYLRPNEPFFVVDATNGRTSWQNYAPQAHAKITSAYLHPRL